MTRCYPCQRNHISGACPRCGRRSTRHEPQPASAEQLSRYAVGGEVELRHSRQWGKGINPMGIGKIITDPNVPTNQPVFVNLDRLREAFATTDAGNEGRGEATWFDFPTAADPTIPEGEVHFQRHGVTVGKIVNVKPERHPCPGCQMETKGWAGHPVECPWRTRNHDFSGPNPRLPLDGRCQSEGHDDYVGWHPGKRLDVDELSFDGPYSDGTSSYSLFLRHDGRWTCDQCWEPKP